MWLKIFFALIDTGAGLRNYYTEYQLDILRHATATPLTVLFMSLAELERELPKNSKSMVKQAITSAKLLEQTVRALNDRSYKQQQVNLTKLLITLCAWCSSTSCSVELKVFPTRKAVFVYNLNEARLQEALLCLVKNAIEASEISPVVSVWIIEREREVMIVIKDFGKGMGALQKFVSWFPYITSKSKNKGLGLFFAKQVIEELQGKVWLKTSHQFGTYVECCIPKHR